MDRKKKNEMKSLIVINDSFPTIYSAWMIHFLLPIWFSHRRNRCKTYVASRIFFIFIFQLRKKPLVWWSNGSLICQQALRSEIGLKKITKTFTHSSQSAANINNKNQIFTTFQMDKFTTAAPNLCRMCFCAPMPLSTVNGIQHIGTLPS